jgi:protein TonB
MIDAGTFQARKHPTALAIVILMHGAALTALALAKTEVLGRHRIPPIVVDTIPDKKPPPPDVPKPPEPTPRAAPTAIDRPPALVDRPFTGPVFFGPTMPPPPPFPQGPTIAPPADPPPPPPRKIEPARARANLASYVSDADYPSSAIRNEEQGTTRFRLGVGADGRVTECTVTATSGSSALDSATCRLMKSRARFTPARDSDGKAVGDSVASGIRWVLPD